MIGPEQLEWFRSLPREEAIRWIDQERARNQALRRDECAANGAHVLEDGARNCPHCDTPYVDPRNPS